MKVLRRIQRPAASLALLALVVVDACVVWDTSTLLWHVRDALGMPPATAASFVSRESSVLFGADPGGGFTIPDHGGPAPYFPYRSGSVEFARLTLEPSLTGAWAPTVRHYDSRVRVYSLNGYPIAGSAFPDAPDALRQAIATRLESAPAWDRSNPMPLFLRDLPRSNIEVPIPLGYAHNTVTLVVLATFAWSLGWAFRLAAQRTRDRRRAAGLCPFCRYDLQGLASAKCPECGKATA